LPDDFLANANAFHRVSAPRIGSDPGANVTIDGPSTDDYGRAVAYFVFVRPDKVDGISHALKSDENESREANHERALDFHSLQESLVGNVHAKVPGMLLFLQTFFHEKASRCQAP
jgi:hypothetical protein